MKARSLLLKVLTVLVFLSLIIVFVVYKSGTFESPKANKPVDTLQQTVAVDTFYMDDNILSSSKSSILVDDELLQTIKEHDNENTKKDTIAELDSVVYERFMMMASSKSTQLYTGDLSFYNFEKAKNGLYKTFIIDFFSKHFGDTVKTENEPKP